MVNGKEAVVEGFVYHHVGAEEDESIFSDGPEHLQSGEEQEFMRRLFLKPFANMAHTSEFTHPVSEEYNVLHGLCRALHEGKDLMPVSMDIAKHLIDSSRHHNIKSGDLFVVKFRSVEIGSRSFDAVGIYKFDDKEMFMETSASRRSISLDLRRGLGNGRPDKACLVVFTDDGYTLFIIDGNSSTEYWQKDFIGHRSKNDHVNSTMNVLEMTKNFITRQLPQDYEIGKADQIDLLNRSVQYFKSNSEFDKEGFEREVFVEENVIRSFQRFGEEFQGAKDVEFLDNFEISAHAVKRQARIFKSVIKLDKNFHIYIHGDRNKIEHGVDEQGRKFYKIFYDEES